MFNLAHYKVEVHDTKLNTYVATPPGLGMFVNILDDNDETILSRVRIDVGAVGGAQDVKCFLQCAHYDFIDVTLVLSTYLYVFHLGHYKVEVFDYKLNMYVATPPGLGMFVNVFDPEQKNLMSRVRNLNGNHDSAR